MAYDPNSELTQVVSSEEWSALIAPLVAKADAIEAASVGGFNLAAVEHAGPADGVESGEDPAITDPAMLFLPEEEAKRLDEEAGFVPSPDQSIALVTLLKALEQPGEYVLTGAAGCGKSTVMKALLRRLTSLWTRLLLAPTWRAANRLREVTGETTASIHRAVYGKPEEQRLCPCGAWSAALLAPEVVEVELPPDGEGTSAVLAKLPRFVCPSCSSKHEDASRFAHRLVFQLRDQGAGGEDGPPPAARIVIIDEASMVGPRTARDVRTALLDGKTRLLWVGDPNQLPPVLDDEEKADTEGAVPLLDPTAALYRVHRQAGTSPVLQLAHKLKTVPEVSTEAWPYPRVLRGVYIEAQVPLDAPARWAALARHAGKDTALITFSNATRAALNDLVRQYSGAKAFADHYGVNLILGDRLLARGNSLGVYNGEVWTLVQFDRVAPGSCLIDERGRGDRERRKRSYRHDRTLEAGVGVWRATVSLAGTTNVFTPCLIVAPLDGRGAPMLESDLIRAGMKAGEARQRCREVAAAWAQEYAAAIEDRQAEFETRRASALDALSARSRFAAAVRDGDSKAAVRALKKLGKAIEVDVDAAAAALSAGLPEDSAAFLEQHRIASPWESVADCGSVFAYCQRVYNALDPKQVAVFDLGEALTCYSMQGSQAAEVGVVFDSPFWGCWRNDRVAALKWAYTAVTRTTDELLLFGIARAK